MNEQLKSIPEHMRRLGLSALAHANWHANYQPYMNIMMNELSVLQAAHAAEILMKARIAEEHPLLIFEQMPRPTKANFSELALRHLFEKGRTIQYSEIPDRLWATTGIRLTNLDTFLEFGRLRNTIQHFAAPPDRDCSGETVDFIYKVIDPFINECWGLFAVDYNEDYEPYVYLVANLVRNEVSFLVSPDLTEHLDEIDFEWPENPKYKQEMESRFETAKSNNEG